jgi:hypothetical protein
MASCAQSAPADHPVTAGSQQATRTARPVITEAEARSLFSEINRKNNQANAAMDAKLLAEYEGEASFRADDTDYRVTRVMEPGRAYKPFEYGDLAFHLPTATGYPQWFIATSTTGGTKRYAMIVSREASGQPWKLVAHATMAGNLPATAKDKTGNAVVVPPADGAQLVAAPRDVAAAHAAYLTAGRSAPEAAMFAADKHSDEVTDDDQTRKAFVFTNTQTGKAGPAEKVSRKVTVEPYPVRALRTSDGGAIVSYVTKLDLVVEQPDGTIRLAGSNAALAGRSEFKDKLTTSWLDQWFVLIPPKGGGKVTVLASHTTQERIS